MRNFTGRRQGLMKKGNMLYRKHGAKVAIFVQYNGIKYSYKSDTTWPVVPDFDVQAENSFSPDNFETVADRLTPLVSDHHLQPYHAQDPHSARQSPQVLSAADELQANILAEVGTDGENRDDASTPASCISSSSSTYTSFTSVGSPQGTSNLRSQTSSHGSEELLEPPSSRTSSKARPPANRSGRGIPPRKNTRSHSRGKQYFVE